MCRFLIVEDDPAVNTLLKEFVHTMGHEAVCVTMESEAKEVIDRNGIDCMILDINLEEGGGRNVMQYMMERGEFIPTIVISGDHQKFEPIRDYENIGFVGFVQKPFFIKEISAMVEKADKVRGDVEKIDVLSIKLSRQVENIGNGLNKLGL